jgi:hypothetical protein
MRMIANLMVAAMALLPYRVEHAPQIDGSLAESVWSRPGRSDFTQVFPADGAAPTAQTSVRIAYDNDNVYFAIDCEQRGPVLGRLTRRDREVNDDRVSIDIDTGHDRRSAYHFAVSASGVQRDALRYDDTEFNSDWDDIWQAEVQRRPHGWSAEIRIPLRIVQLHRGVTTWGLQVRRWIGSTGEIDQWAYWPRDSGGEVSRYGDVGPFESLTPRGSWSMVPFGLSRLVSASAALPSTFNNGLSVAAGVDLTWRPGHAIELSAAVFPDFGQVEADQVVINLSTTETEFDDKRAFFVRGSDVFATPIRLLYTRRIGQSASSPALPENLTLRAPVGAAPVLAAAKLAGSVAGIDVGVLSAFTGAVDARVNESSRSISAALMTSHSALRLRTQWRGFTIGATTTAQLQRETPALYPELPTTAAAQPVVLCAGGARVALGQRCGHDSFAQGLDVAWQSQDSAWLVSGQAVLSARRGGPPSTRSDGTQLRAGDQGGGVELRAAKQSGALRGEVAYGLYSRRFDIDALGFLPRANVQRLEVDLETFTARPHGPLIEARSRIEVFLRRNLDGAPLPSGYQWNVSGTGRGLWSFFAELHWRPRYEDDREFGDGRVLERSGRLGAETSLRSDPNRSVVLGGAATVVRTHNGYNIDASASLRVLPASNVEIEIEPEYQWRSGEPRLLDVGSASQAARVGRQYLQSLGVTTRGTWTLTKRLSLQGYAQALIAKIAYRDALLADPSLRTVFIDRLEPGEFDPSQFNEQEGAVNANLVARWEFLPGSTAFLVYAHQQIPDPGAAAFSVFDVFRGPATDAVLIKLSWALLK